MDGGWAVDALLGCQTRVHQDLDLAELLERGFERGLHVVLVADVHAEGGSLAAFGFDLFGYRGELLFVPRHQRDGRATFGESQGAGPADPL